MLSDFLIALNEHEKALKVLSILVSQDQNPIIKNQYEMIKANVAQRKQPAQSKQQINLQKQIQNVRNECFCTLKLDETSANTQIRKLLEMERGVQVSRHAQAMAKELGIPPQMYHVKAREFRRRHQEILDAEFIELSDEGDDPPEFSQEDVELYNQKLLGYQKDYSDQIEDIQTEGKKKPSKEKPGNAQNQEAPRFVTPLEFTKLKVSELFKEDREHFFMDQNQFQKVDCQTCKLINDYS